MEDDFKVSVQGWGEFPPGCIEHQQLVKMQTDSVRIWVLFYFGFESLNSLVEFPQACLFVNRLFWDSPPSLLSYSAWSSTLTLSSLYLSRSLFNVFV